LQIGDIVRLCFALKYDIVELMAESWPANQRGD